MNGSWVWLIIMFPLNFLDWFLSFFFLISVFRKSVNLFWDLTKGFGCSKGNVPLFQFEYLIILSSGGSFDLKICGHFSSPVLFYYRVLYCVLVCWHLARECRGWWWRSAVLCLAFSLFYAFLCHRLSGCNLFENSDFFLLNSVKHPFLFFLVRIFLTVLVSEIALHT